MISKPRYRPECIDLEVASDPSGMHLISHLIIYSHDIWNELWPSTDTFRKWNSRNWSQNVKNVSKWSFSPLHYPDFVYKLTMDGKKFVEKFTFFRNFSMRVIGDTERSRAKSDPKPAKEDIMDGKKPQIMLHSLLSFRKFHKGGHHWHIDHDHHSREWHNCHHT